MSAAAPDPGARALAARRSAGLFELPDRGVLEVGGGDAQRWLDGMITNDVMALAPGPQRSGCYAALLTPQGRVVADLHVLLRGASFWLETAREGIAAVTARLERYIIADDVALADRSADFARFAVEGVRARRVLETAIGGELDLEQDACSDARIVDVDVVVAAFGVSGEPSYQLFAPTTAAAGVAEALRRAGASLDLVEGDLDALEVLRIEAGTPKLGAELDESVLPAEARLERAISTTKGCYTGQEVVARLRSQGKVSHLLVGLELDPTASLPEPGATISEGEKAIGELTSAARSAVAGAIALGFVRRAHAEPGKKVSVADASARVAALPFVEPGTAPDS